MSLHSTSTSIKGEQWKNLDEATVRTKYPIMKIRYMNYSKNIPYSQAVKKLEASRALFDEKYFSRLRKIFQFHRESVDSHRKIYLKIEIPT